MSYRKKHVKNKIGKTRPKKSIFKKLWFWILLLFLILVLAVSYFALFYPGIQIKNIVISGNNKITTQEIQDIVMNNANTGLVRFSFINIMSRSILLLDINKLDKDILGKFPIIEKIKIDKNFPQTLTLGITERKPIGVYCQSPAGNNQRCFLIDENGIIFEPLSTPSADFPIVRQTLDDPEGTPSVYTGEQVVGQNIITAILQIQKDLKDNFQINLTDALVTSPVRLDITTDGNWQIYFSLEGDNDINSQLVKLNLLLNGDINPDVRKILQYIDLRFKDRAYYK